eukprot:gene31410-biopygen23833
MLDRMRPPSSQTEAITEVQPAGDLLQNSPATNRYITSSSPMNETPAPIRKIALSGFVLNALIVIAGIAGYLGGE